MTEPLVSTLTVSYSSSETDSTGETGNGLALERHFGFTGFKRGIPFRQYPPVPAKLVCSKGTIDPTPEYRSSDENEVVIFSGSKTANLKRPQATAVTYSMISDIAFNENGDVVYPVITFDADENALVSNVAFYGGVNVRYQAPYLLYFYEFKTDIDPVSNGVTFYGGDVIHAFYKKHHAELTMEMDFKRSQQWLPFYTVTTKIVLDELGIWEYPKNWETADQSNYLKKQDDPSRTNRGMGLFPDWSTYAIDPDLSFTDTRVHQIGEYDVMGRVRSSIPNNILHIQEPYWGSSNYLDFAHFASLELIQFNFELASRPTWKRGMSFSERAWIDAWLSIDLNEIIEDLKRDYPHIKKNGVEL